MGSSWNSLGTALKRLWGKLWGSSGEALGRLWEAPGCGPGLALAWPWPGPGLALAWPWPGLVPGPGATLLQDTFVWKTHLEKVKGASPSTIEDRMDRDLLPHSLPPPPSLLKKLCFLFESA